MSITDLTSDDYGGVNRVARQGTDYFLPIDIIMQDPLGIYRFIEDTYKQSGYYRTGEYLHAYFLEVMDAFIERKGDSTPVETFRRIVNALVGPVFTKPPVRDLNVNGSELKSTDDNMVNGFMKSADVDGNTLTEVMHSAINWGAVLSVSFIVMDNWDDIPQLKTEKIAGKYWPFLEIKKITCLALDADKNPVYTLDRRKQLESITFFDNEMKLMDYPYQYRSEILSITNASDEDKVKTYRYWSKEKTSLWVKDGKGNLIELNGTIKELKLNKIPVITIFSVKRDNKNTILVDPQFYDIAKIVWRLYNSYSELIEIKRGSAFPQKVIPDADESIKTGMNNIISIDGNSTAKPEWLTPDADIFRMTQEGIDSEELRVLKAASQEGVNAVKSSQSGYAKEFDFRAEEEKSKEIAQLASKVEMRVWEIWNEYVPSEKVDGIVQYRNVFTPMDTLRLIEEAATLINEVGVAPETKELIVVDLIKKIYKESVSEEKLEEVIEAEKQNMLRKTEAINKRINETDNFGENII